MTTAGLRNIKALCEQQHDREAQAYAREHTGHAQVLGREINELVREHKEYLQILEKFDFKIANAALPILSGNSGFNFRGSTTQQVEGQRKAREELMKTFASADAKLNEMHGRLSIIAVGINTLRG